MLSVQLASSTYNKKYIIPMYTKQTTGTAYMKGTGWILGGAVWALILPIN